MTFSVDSGTNSAAMSGLYGLQQASQGITQTSQDIASRTVAQSAGSEGAVASPSSGGLTSNLLSLTSSETHAQASAKVLDTAFDTVGTLIDIKV